MGGASGGAGGGTSFNTPTGKLNLPGGPTPTTPQQIATNVGKFQQLNPGLGTQIGTSMNPLNPGQSPGPPTAPPTQPTQPPPWAPKTGPIVNPNPPTAPPPTPVMGPSTVVPNNFVPTIAQGSAPIQAPSWGPLAGQPVNQGVAAPTPTSAQTPPPPATGGGGGIQPLPNQWGAASGNAMWRNPDGTMGNDFNMGPLPGYGQLQMQNPMQGYGPGPQVQQVGQAGAVWQQPGTPQMATQQPFPSSTVNSAPPGGPLQGGSPMGYGGGMRSGMNTRK